MYMKKIVVLGGTGFLGASVVGALQKRGYDVAICSRRTGVDARSEQQLTDYLQKAKPDTVINCAAHVGGIAYNAQRPVTVYEDNLQLGFTIVRSTFHSGVSKLVNIMPNCTYPGEMERFAEEQWWDGPMHPTVLTYGMPRKAAWVQAWAYKQEHGFNSIHLVLPNLFGPRDHFDIIRSHALGALIRKIADAKSEGRSTVDIWGSGKAIREWMYVEDAAEGIVRATEGYDDLEILNLGCGKGISMRDLAELIREEVGWNGNFHYDTSRPDGALCKIIDTTRMQRILQGWMPSTPFRAGIAQTIQWYRDHFHESLASVKSGK
jgi:GDP-L-fucose synthase